ncbi:MAG TPA: DinB family protein [Candidatus Binatia bacterium]|nr:DinB family protein [Candidatus Binatia bacterium]
MRSLEVLRGLIARLPARLAALPAGKVEHKPAPNTWSVKEELGHLLDSAANNHQRIVRTQLEEKPAMPDYDGDAWVALHRYQQRDWETLIGLWVALNRQLLAAAEAVPQAGWSRTCTIGDSAPLTLQFVFDDYVAHMLHHLRHMGVEVDDLAGTIAAAS